MPDHGLDVKFLEDWDVVLWSEIAVSVITYVLGVGGREGKELAWDNPVKVTVLYLLVELVFLDIESVETEPAHLHTELQTAETVEDGALVGT